MNGSDNTPVLLRMTTVPMSLKYLMTGQMKFMQEHGLNVHMASADGPEREDAVGQKQSKHHILPLTRNITPTKDLYALWKAVQLMRSIEPDIVHTHTPKAGLIGMWAARLSGVPIRIHTLAGLPLQTTTGFKRQLLQWTERATYDSATEVWPNNYALREYIVEQEWIDEDKCRVIGSGSSNGIDLDFWSEEAVNSKLLHSLKSEIQYDDRAQYFLFVGRLVRDKGLEELVETFVTLHGEEPSVHLILAGSFARRRSSERLSQQCIRSIRESPFIHSVGWSDHIREWMALADGLVFPSHREGFPNVLLQAGAMKLPIVCSDIEEHRQLIDDRNTGLLFPVADPDALLDRMRYVLRASDEVHEWTDRLHDKIERDFQQEHIHRVMFDQYRRLLKENGYI